MIATLENLSLKLSDSFRTEGPLKLPETFWNTLYAAPLDTCPGFEGPPGYRWADARGKDHPRYGRFVYAFAKAFRPQRVVEVGTDTGGTAVSWARALSENGSG